MSLAAARSADEVESVLKAALVRLPETTNPWTLFKSTAFVILNHPSPAAFAPLLIAASCFLAITTILYISGLVVRWRKGTLWWFRLVRVGEEVFILPHYVVSYLTLAIVFNLCLQSFLWIVWYRTVKHVQAKNHFLANSLPWIPGIMAVCLAVWSLTTTWILHRRAYRNGGRQPWYTSAKLINSAGILLPFVVLATLLPYGIMASINLEHSQRDSAKLYEVLERGAAAWSPGATIDSGELRLTSVLVYDVKAKMTRFQQTYEIFFSTLAGWCGFLGITFVVVASLYLRDLKHSIKGMQGRTKTGVETFARTFRWLVLVTIGLGTSMIALAANVSWIAATLRKILSDGKTNAVAIIVPLFTVAALSVPVSIVILHNAITTPSARAQSSSSARFDSQHSTLGSKPTPPHHQQSHRDRGGRGNVAAAAVDNLDQTYTTQFDLVAALPLDRFAFLSTAIDIGGGGGGGDHDRLDSSNHQNPFDSLELELTKRRNHHKLEGIIVERSEETVTVVALPRDDEDLEREAATWNNNTHHHFDEDDDDDDKKW